MFMSSRLGRSVSSADLSKPGIMTRKQHPNRKQATYFGIRRHKRLIQLDQRGTNNSAAKPKHADFLPNFLPSPHAQNALERPIAKSQEAFQYHAELVEHILPRLRHQDAAVNSSYGALPAGRW